MSVGPIRYTSYGCCGCYEGNSRQTKSRCVDENKIMRASAIGKKTPVLAFGYLYGVVYAARISPCAARAAVKDTDT